MRLVARDRKLRRDERNSNATASRRFTPAVKATTRKFPNQETRQNPVTRDPTIAPSVFAAYALPTVADSLKLFPRARPIKTTTAGKLKPNTMAMGRTVRAEVTNCARTSPPKVWWVSRRSTGTSDATQGNRIKEARATTPVQVCVRENVASDTPCERAEYR